MKRDDNALIDQRALLLLVLGAVIGVMVGLAGGLGAGVMAGLGAVAILHALVRRN